MKAPVGYITGKIHYLADTLRVRYVTRGIQYLQALLSVG